MLFSLILLTSSLFLVLFFSSFFSFEISGSFSRSCSNTSSSDPFKIAKGVFTAIFSSPSFTKIEVIFPPPKETDIVPNDIPLDILYEDKDLVVINKAPGVVIHPGAGNYDNTIVNGLLFKYKNKLSSIGGRLRPGIVHRIDKDTSGVIVVAKNDISHINLSEQFKNHSIERTYEALIWGSLKPQSGKISEKISRSIKNRQLMSVRKEKGKIAITNYSTFKILIYQKLVSLNVN